MFIWKKDYVALLEEIERNKNERFNLKSTISHKNEELESLRTSLLKTQTDLDEANKVIGCPDYTSKNGEERIIITTPDGMVYFDLGIDYQVHLIWTKETEEFGYDGIMVHDNKGGVVLWINKAVNYKIVHNC